MPVLLVWVFMYFPMLNVTLFLLINQQCSFALMFGKALQIVFLHDNAVQCFETLCFL